jgi:TonB family protein
MSIWFKTLTLALALCFGLAVPSHQNPGNRRVIEMKAPAYPRIAQTVHAIGTVKIEVEIDKQGSVVSAHAISGHPLLQAVSAQAARNWRFEADQKNSTVVLLFDFFDGNSAEASSVTDRCRDSFSVVDPYHIKIFGYTKVEASSDVEDSVPKDLEGTTQSDPCTGKEVQMSPRYAEVLFCPACRRAKERWSKAHPNTTLTPDETKRR